VRNFEFPKKDFVWDSEKIDSRPYKSMSVLHFLRGLGQILAKIRSGECKSRRAIALVVHRLRAESVDGGQKGGYSIYSGSKGIMGAKW
jgi:hypothetical protein